jgi:flagellin-like protein
MVELFARLIFRLRRLMLTETDLNVRRAVSPLLATLILIAIVVSAGLVVYGIVSGWMGIFGANLKVQAASVDLVKAGDKALLSVSIKNVGNKPLAGIVVTGRDDNGKPFKLALPPAESGQASGNTLVIPLGVSNIVLDASGNNNHATMYGAPSWVEGKSGKAMYFDGSDVNKRVQMYPFTNFPTSEISAMFWMKSSDVSRAGTPLSYATSHSDNEFLIYNYGSFGVYVGGSSVGTGASANDGSWRHVAVLWRNSDGQVKLFKDGNPAYSGSLQRGYSIVGGGSLIFAQEQDSVGDSFDISQAFVGTLDEACIYGRFLGDEEIRWNFNHPGLPVTRGLALWLPLDE